MDLLVCERILCGCGFCVFGGFGVCMIRVDGFRVWDWCWDGGILF